MTEPEGRTDHRDDVLTFEQAVTALRADVPVRAEWRDALLQEVAKQPQPALHLPTDVWSDIPAKRSSWNRSFAVRPVAAIAACLLAMAVGATGTLIVIDSSLKSVATSVATSAVSSTATSTANPTAPVDEPPRFPVVNAAGDPPRDNRQVIRFALVAPGAASVSLVGDFNNWDPRATPLRATRDGNTWTIEMSLSEGRHVYAFMVDGDIVADPSAPRVVDHDFGVQNSVILVGSL